MQEPPGTPPDLDAPVYEPSLPEPPVNPEVPVIDKSTPYTGEYSNESVLERYMNKTLTYGDIAKLVAAGMVLPSILDLVTPTPDVPGPRTYAPLPPVNWGSAEPLINPGVNPGFVGGPAQQPFYQTTSPVQSKYYYGTRPLIQTPDQIQPTLQDRTYAPVTPFGLQQMQQGYDLNQVLNQINQTPLNPNFVGYNQYPTAGYQPIGPVIPPT